MLFFISFSAWSQSSHEQKMAEMPVVRLENGIVLTFDEPKTILSKPTKIIIYALPNGNTTAQTIGKKLAKGDDWHFDIQHIGAQTTFIRETDVNTNYIVVYLENDLKSWPQWRKQIKNGDDIIHKIVDDIYRKYSSLKPKLILSGHSGGGSLIFGFINAQPKLPKYVQRIAFLDATYGYETEKHQQKLKKWLSAKGKSLQVIAYNDSVVVYNDKPLVTPTGGTWYRSKLMVQDLGQLKLLEKAEQSIWANKSASISFILINNPEAKIFHTVLVEKNGFIHCVFNGTKLAEKNYKFWNEKAYQSFILE
jgi:hypothetical protein